MSASGQARLLPGYHQRMQAGVHPVLLVQGLRLDADVQMVHWTYHDKLILWRGQEKTYAMFECQLILIFFSSFFQEQGINMFNCGIMIQVFKLFTQ